MLDDEHGLDHALEPVPFLDLAPSTRAVAIPVLDGWTEAMGSSSFIGGPHVESFEREFARLCGSEHAIGTANGTDALHLALRALGIGPGHEVVLPTNTFVATAEAVVLAGAVPRFADVDPDTLLLTPESLAAAVTPRTRAVVVVHLYGQMPDMTALVSAARELGLLLVEDAAQAHGATWRGRPAGSFGVVGCFSFYPGKNLGAFGDAGAVVTSDSGVAERVRALRDHGRPAQSHHGHEVVGTNSRLDVVQAIVLSAKLPWLGRWNQERRWARGVYEELLDPETARLVPELADSCGAYHLLVVRVRDRDAVRARLADRGIGTGIHYPTPCHRLEPYAPWGEGPLPVAEQAADEILSLPMFPGITQDAVERVAAEVNRATVSRALR